MVAGVVTKMALSNKSKIAFRGIRGADQRGKRTYTIGDHASHVMI